MKITVLPGDGIGPEVVSEALKVLDTLSSKGLAVRMARIGRTAHHQSGCLLPARTVDAVKSSDAVLLGAVGANVRGEADDLKPERSLLMLRKLLNCFVNLRPIKHHKSVRIPVITEGNRSDILIVRELNSGIYFGVPRGVRRFHFSSGEHLTEGFSTSRYSDPEVENIVRIALEMASNRKKRLLLVDKANVLETSMVWRKKVTSASGDYKNVELTTSYVDSASLLILRSPEDFDVVLADNLFGDILSDHLSLLVGSIGLLPSASVGLGWVGLYEPVHGSAPSLTGRGLANPIAAILSLALMLRYSLGRNQDASVVEIAVSDTLRRGYRTTDMTPNQDFVSTAVMGDSVASQVKSRLETDG